MSLESFFGMEDSESSGSAEASEKFQEQMRKNAAAIKAMTAHQQQQQQQEDKLAKLLIKLLQDKAYADLVFLIIKLLEENVPGAFIVSILTLINSEMEKELIEIMKTQSEANEYEFAPVFDSNLLPDNLKKQLHAWGGLVIRAGIMRPGKTLSSVLTHENKLKSLVLDLVIYSLEEFFIRHGMQLKEYALLSLQAVFIKLKEKNKEISDMELIETEPTV